jgi:hypothetical protein
VSATIRIVPASKYVRLEYIPINNAADGARLFAEASSDTSIDFVESLVFSAETSVLMLGQYANDAGSG